MSSFPHLDKTVCHHPHLVILGAGASVAACPSGDAFGNRLPLMNDLIQITGLESLLNERGKDTVVENFEAFYSDLASCPENDALVTEVQNRIRAYFSGLQIPDEPTIYDYLLLCLRSKDVVATFNWDPFLAQAHERNIRVGGMPEIYYLHGNVEIGICLEHRMRGFTWQDCRECGKPLSLSKLLFPVKEKNYGDDPFIANEWRQLEFYLQHAYWITIFGYSAPATDLAARELMLKVWRANSVKDFAQIEIVDIKSRSELRRTWSDFIVRENFGVYKDLFRTYMFTHPRRSCDAFAGATLQGRPWKDNPIPKFDTLDDLHNWIAPLIAEEAQYDKDGTPFSDRLVFGQ